MSAVFNRFTLPLGAIKIAGMEFRLDYISCLLTIVSTVMVGRRLWTGWVVAALNSVLICIIGLHTKQFGFIPANLFCIALYAWNLQSWVKASR